MFWGGILSGGAGRICIGRHGQGWVRIGQGAERRGMDRLGKGEGARCGGEVREVAERRGRSSVHSAAEADCGPLTKMLGSPSPRRNNVHPGNRSTLMLIITDPERSCFVPQHPANLEYCHRQVPTTVF